MQDKKQKKAKIQVIFLILISTLVILADFYAIINYPKEYMLIAAITVIFMICLWGVISGFFSLSALKEDRREEQYDSIFKSEKASYLMLRKYFDEIEGKIEILQKESKIPTEDIINAQKGIAKVVINRNKENADAIMNSNEQLMETFEHLENKLKESNDFIIESQKNVIYDNLKDIMEKQQVLSDSIKDMEIRLSQAITANPIQFTANVEMPKQTTDAPQSAPAMEAIPEPVVEEAAIAEPEPVAVIEPEPVIEAPEPEPVVEPSPVAEEAVADTTDSDPNRQLSADEIAALFASANAGATEPESEPTEKVITEPVTEAPQVPEPEPVVEPSPAAEEAVADTTNSDPNRQLSADEIAALFASANAGATEPESEPAEEVITEPVTEAPQAPEPEPVSEPEPAKSPVVDLNNTNRNLTPDEIAALFSSM
ncbi:hypothetical protein PNE36_12345 [[Eubacterium] rectale]|uniref:Uncharacterized protein n=2 Tax=Agathobacter rectalis TaxID=39491 RepID=A0AAP3Q3W6_9FIRM|nr:hypothetical protein [Agathobacter rectalis]MDB8015732.1 hypothetical protein [Agathobacter rectalis]MDB8018738.1 hypothetical protein [Agathobacter rectalis]MDB8022053.1 hypothetical protein [Agathobacter rectalis]MDB8029698.1 hypothetical protein [Agathobacter rectalis]